MKPFLQRSIVAGLLLLAAGAAFSQNYPSKPVSLMVPYPAGGPSDAAARIFTVPLGKELGQQVVVENLGGVAGALAAQKVLAAPADGYYLFQGSPNEVILSPLDLISVVFHEATPENTYRSGEPTSETLIFCHIRDGRSDGAVLSLAKKVSSIWSACTGAPEDEVEVLVALYPAKYVVRGGERLPEAPRV